MPATDKTDIQCVVAEEPAAYSDAIASSDEDTPYTKVSEVTNGLKTVRIPKQTASFESLPSKKNHEAFIRTCVDVLLKEAVFEGTSRHNKVVDFHNPEELEKLFDFGLRNDPSTHDALVKLLKDTVQYSVKTGHPYFVNQLFSSLDAYGLVGQWLTDSLNPSVYTYEVTPVFTLMEETVLREMRRIVGFEEGRGDGIFCPGGSMANGYAINCARYKFLPDVKTKGLHSLPRLVLFTSEDAHYSVSKMAAFLGIGTDNVYLVKTDARGRMDVDHLEQEVKRSISEGWRPLYGQRHCRDDGDKHVQCGRRVDVLKFWFMWKAKGTSGLEQHIDKVFENAKFFVDTIMHRPGFELVVDEPECTNICFWYVPPSLRGAKSHPDYVERLHKVAPKIKERMMKEGTMMVTYQAVKRHPNFFRIVFQNSGLEKSDMLYLIEEFERLGKDL
ncbi:hypothetical protein NQ318_006733 [Aromia moschata]|uniref:Cysteine sulfinic acid decarboxylase n=1 Tax=Aromia moschata TaxID=1265417 RepID=A0AAV8YD57_9CUCU|nr:hypothetical protein NQ318_006733 [Aromia moschata]